MTLIFSLIFCFLVLAKDVEIEVKGTWKSPGLASMASEFFEEIPYKEFWDIFDIRKNGDTSFGKLSSQLEVGDRKLFEFSMSIHYFAPLLNTFQHLGEQRLLTLPPEHEDSDLFVDCGGDNVFFTLDEMKEFFSSKPPEFENDEVKLYPFDHIYKRQFQPVMTCLLYGSIEDDNILPFHEYLKDREEIQYLFRHYYHMDVERRDHFTSKTYDELDSIQGYGMSLVIKNQEYRTMDPKNRPKAQAPSEFSGIRFDYLIENNPDLDFKINLFREHLVKELFDLGGELKAWDIQDIGFSMSQLIADSDDPLSTLQEMTTDFPNHVADILESAKGRDPQSNEWFNNWVKNNAEKLGVTQDSDTQARLFFNNKELDLETTTIFTLRDIIKEELEGFNLIRTFEDELPFSDDEEEMETFSNLMTGKDVRSTDRIFDIISFPQIHWMNDIENDRKYQGLDPSVKSLLRPPQYGRQPIPRRNMFQFIYLVDPSTSEGVELVWKAREIINYGAPFRIGFVFYPFTQAEQTSLNKRFDVNVMGMIHEEEDNEFEEPTIGEKLLTVMGYIREKSGTAKMYDFILFFRNFLGTHGMITDDELRGEFGRHAPRGLNYHDLIYNKDNFEKYSAMILQDTFEMLSEKNIPKKMEKPIVLMNGRLIQNSDPTQLEFSNLLRTDLEDEFGRMKRLIEGRVVTDSDGDVFLKVMEYHQDLEEEDEIGRVFERYNEQVFATSSSGGGGWNSKYNTAKEVVEIIPTQSIPFISGHNNNGNELIPYTHILCSIEEDSRIHEQSMETIETAVRYFSNHREGQVGIVYSSHETKASEFDLKVFKFFSDYNNNKKESCNINLYETINSIELSPEDFVSEERVLEGRKFCSSHYESSTFFLSSHGKIIEDVTKFTSPEDYEVLEKYLSNLQLLKLFKVFKKYENINNINKIQNLYIFYSSLFLQMVSEKGSSGGDSNNNNNIPNFDGIDETFSVKKILSDEDGRGVLPSVKLILDPLSPVSPKWSTIVNVLFSEFFQFDVDVYLTPKSGISTLPLQSWYRFVLFPTYNSDDNNNNNKAAIFEDIPDRYILTVTPDESEGWLLESTYSEFDLDNLNLELLDDDEEKKARIRYQLENIVYTGRAYDQTLSTSPRGLQFELVEEKGGNVVDDTLVMSNYGYFQFKANPGVFNFRISGVRANAIYRLSRVDMGDQMMYEIGSEEESEKEKDVSVFVTHFDGAEIHVKVQRRPGMGKVELFDDKPLPGSQEDNDENKKGIFSRIFGGNSGNDVAKDLSDDDGYINIFSVASGHLYERLLRIMMRSIMEHTTTKKVRFLIIKNYLSPQFKEYLPHISEKYGFEYSLITYKWPTWLHKQTNKIRIIWAYKVLFLDVLFPLEVKKIIYVDADQVTRADMTELWDMDLRHRVIALTPFCNDKPEMDGYAFWKRGYWEKHLQGKPYHISALYVVDVENFRKRYAGDQYRMVYSNLAKDPNSLSNLDQDLPNFVQHMIPIHSLPQEWLWCETWCSDNSKGRAKTIDLCNNPMTKEHKVTQAKRIVGEWIAYDEEMTMVVNSIQEKEGIVER